MADDGPNGDGGAAFDSGLFLLGKERPHDGNFLYVRQRPVGNDPVGDVSSIVLDGGNDVGRLHGVGLNWCKEKGNASD